MSLVIYIILLIIFLAIAGYVVKEAGKVLLAALSLFIALVIFIFPGFSIMSFIVDINSYDLAKLFTWSFLIGLLAYGVGYLGIYIYDPYVDSERKLVLPLALHTTIFAAFLLTLLFQWLLG